MPDVALPPLSAAAWALVGGSVVEALELAGALRRAKALPWKRPGEPRLPAYLLSVVLRLAAGAGLAAVFGADGQLGGPFAAGSLGITAPLMVEKMLRQVGKPEVEDGTA
ncbi:hypothetical protein ACWT_4755 [Actinoplanes sp. SE50]|uniref:hypothetical protein n=1 Tax=unclassified Actinoplanes TaxID=2626549 RepID=UPI00023EC11C|nr:MULTISPECIES: hypothetical protein [unclassified Actinoplanes]AEV85776.1 hypothetical protein ACPL_4885 [Actinoplanes sp. SE50/110]ATO84170.1 hypothetical protein ACWT_4755 [Actinoplanes sp. SE50]SLM01580.1 hypothetical protein ACSP50_4816 [Actinoplanes sp. SE50/110]